MLQIAKYSKSGPIIKITPASIEYIKNIYSKSFSSTATLFFAPWQHKPTEFYIYLPLMIINNKSSVKTDRTFHCHAPLVAVSVKEWKCFGRTDGAPKKLCQTKHLSFCIIQNYLNWFSSPLLMIIAAGGVEGISLRIHGPIVFLNRKRTMTKFNPHYLTLHHAA